MVFSQTVSASSCITIFVDDEGRISIDNLKQACREAGCRFSKQEMEEMMEEADTNGDGYVDPDEFIRIMLQTNLF